MNCEVAVQRGNRPSLLLGEEKKRHKRNKPTGEEKLSQRYANGLDLWTGAPYTGHAAYRWLMVWFDKPEDYLWNEWARSMTIEKVDGKDVYARLANGKLVRIFIDEEKQLCAEHLYLVEEA
jgi:hypothetical protein